MFSNKFIAFISFLLLISSLVGNAFTSPVSPSVLAKDNLSPNNHNKLSTALNPTYAKGSLESKIIGGTDASLGEFPWQVSLQENQFGILTPFCGGAILNERTIVTAAHCVFDMGPNDFMVVAGAHSVYNPDGTEQSVAVASIRVYPSFDPATYDNDVAVLTLSAPLTYTSRVRNIALATSDIIPTGTCRAIGWGNVRNDGQVEYAEILQKVDLVIVERSTCEDILNDINPITPGMICANGNYKGTCNGDSGSAFMCRAGGTEYLAGVVSWGVDVPYCVFNPAYPSVFTNMAHFSSWILSTLQ